MFPFTPLLLTLTSQRAMIGPLTVMKSGQYSIHPLAFHFIIHFRRRAVTSRTKMIIVNTPHNPIGKVFTRKELQVIADIAEEFNLLVMSDEVVSILDLDL